MLLEYIHLQSYQSVLIINVHIRLYRVSSYCFVHIQVNYVCQVNYICQINYVSKLITSFNLDKLEKPL